MAHRALMQIRKNLPKTIISAPYRPEYLLVLDFEATCEKDILLQPQEIIEFPCVALSTKDWNVKDVFHKYVRPRIHPELTAFCTELTGIIQETVDNEPYFPEILSQFISWLEKGGYFEYPERSAIVTCGNWDLRMMLPTQCKLDNLEVPETLTQWINLKDSFCYATKSYPRSLNDMLTQLNLSFNGKMHSGISDTINMIQVIETLANRYNAEFRITSNFKSSTKLK